MTLLFDAFLDEFYPVNGAPKKSSEAMARAADVEVPKGTLRENTS